MSEAPPSNNPKDCEENVSYTSIRPLLILWVIFLYPYFSCTPVAKFFTGFFCIPLATFFRCPEVNGGVWRMKGLSLNFDRQLPMLLFLRLFKTTRNVKWSLKIKWIILDLLIKKPFHWFIMKIMMITVHRIQAGKTRSFWHKAWYHRSNIDPTIKAKSKTR